MPRFSDSSDHDDQDDILAEYENRSDDGQGNLSGEEENETQTQEEDEDDKETATQGRRIDPSTSRKTRNPIPKLNVERLKGPKGIQTIEKYFEGFKFHGKGHEKADLDRVMKRLEHWAHRLFPKLDYDDFLKRVEVLGKKKELQVFVKKYRMDMITPDESTQPDADVADEKEEEEETEPIDEFDLLIAEQIEKQKQASIQKASQADVSASQSSSAVFDRLIAATVDKNPEPRKENAPSQMTDEIRERIERNRQQAIQRRLARLQAMQEEAKRKKLEESDKSQPVEEAGNSNPSQA